MKYAALFCLIMGTCLQAMQTIQIDFLQEAILNSDAIETQALLETYKDIMMRPVQLEHYKQLAKETLVRRAKCQNETDLSFITVGGMILLGALTSGWHALSNPNNDHAAYEYTAAGFGLGTGLEVIRRGFNINKTKYHNALTIEKLLKIRYKNPRLDH